MKRCIYQTIIFIEILLITACSAVGYVRKSDTIVRYEVRDHKYFFPKKLGAGYNLKDLRPQDYILNGKLYTYEDVLLLMCFNTASNRERYRNTKVKDKNGNYIYEYDEKAIYKLNFKYLPSDESKKHTRYVSLPHIPMQRGGKHYGTEDKNAVELEHNSMLKLVEEFYTTYVINHIESNTDNIKMDIWAKEELEKRLKEYPKLNDYTIDIAIYPDIKLAGLAEANSGQLVSELNRRAVCPHITMSYSAFQIPRLDYCKSRIYLTTFSHELMHLMGVACHAEDAALLFPDNPYANEVKKYMLGNFIIRRSMNIESHKQVSITPEELVLLDFINSSDYYYQNYDRRGEFLLRYIHLSRYKVGAMYLREALQQYNVKLFRERVEELKNDPYFMEYLLSAYYSVDESYYGYNAKGAYYKRGIKDDIDTAERMIISRQKQNKAGEFLGKILTKEEIEYNKTAIKAYEKIIEKKYKPLLKRVDPIVKIYPQVREIVSEYVPKELMDIESEEGFRFKFKPVDKFIHKNIMYMTEDPYIWIHKYREEYATSETGINTIKKSAFYQRMEEHLKENNPEVLEIYINDIEANFKDHYRFITVERFRLGSDEKMKKKLKEYKKRLKYLKRKRTDL